MDVDVIEREQVRLLCVRHTGPYGEIGEAFGRLGAIAGAAGLFGNPGAAMYGVYYDDPDSTAPEALRSAAGIAAPIGVPVPDGLTEVFVPAGRYARMVVMGPYDQLAAAWEQLVSVWFPGSGEEMADAPSCEHYVNDPESVPEADIRTDLLLPLVPKS